MVVNEDNFILHLRKRNEKALYYVIDNYGGLIKGVIKKTFIQPSKCSG